MKKILFTWTALLPTLTLFAAHYPDSVQWASDKELRIENGWNFECLGGLAVSQIAYQHWGQQPIDDHVVSVSVFPTYTAGLGLNYFFTPWLGLGTGARFSSYRTVAQFCSPWTYSGTDYQGHTYTQTLTPSDLGEKQTINFLEVPLLLRFRHRPIDHVVGFTGAIGVMLGLPMYINCHSLSDDNMLYNEVYYPELDVTLRDIPTVIENGHVPTYERTLPLSNACPINWAAHAQLGLLFHLQQRLCLGVSAYVTYYINDVVKDLFRQPMGFADCLPMGEYMGSELYHQPYSSLLTTSIVRSVHPWQAGLMLSLSIDAGRTRAQKKFDRQQRSPKQPKEQDEPLIPVVVRDTVLVPSPEQELIFVDEAEAICEQNNVLGNYTIFFHFDRIEPILEPEDILIHVANVLKQHPTKRVYVTGHTCSIGTKVYNATLSRRRADAVAERLHALGVPREQMVIRSVGADEPLKTDGPHSMIMDRRVEITPIE